MTSSVKSADALKSFTRTSNKRQLHNDKKYNYQHKIHYKSMAIFPSEKKINIYLRKKSFPH